jgi:magnesium transporter
MLKFYPAPPESEAPTVLHPRAVWIDLIEPTEEETHAVEGLTGLHVPGRRELAEIEVSSRLRRKPEALYLSTPLVSFQDGKDPRLTPVGFVLGEDRLITVRFANYFAFDAAAAEAVDAGEAVTAQGVFVDILEAIVDRLADLLETASGELDHISRDAFRGEKSIHDRRSTARQRRTLTGVGAIGDKLSQIRDTLLGVERIVTFVAEGMKDRRNKDVALRLAALRADLGSLGDYESRLADKVQFLLDAVLGFISVEQNDIFKLLTIVSVVGIPPTLIASMYGMNFHNMPELSWRYGYQFGLAMIVLSTLAPLGWFKWRGWL